MSRGENEKVLAAPPDVRASPYSPRSDSALWRGKRDVDSVPLPFSRCASPSRARTNPNNPAQGVRLCQPEPRRDEARQRGRPGTQARAVQRRSPTARTPRHKGHTYASPSRARTKPTIAAATAVMTLSATVSQRLAGRDSMAVTLPSSFVALLCRHPLDRYREPVDGLGELLELVEPPRVAPRARLYLGDAPFEIRIQPGLPSAHLPLPSFVSPSR